MKSFISRSEEDTSKIAKEFSAKLKDGMIISLNGNLGSGKTYFIRKVLEQFGLQNVSSPTFSIVNEYSNSKKFFHFDFYRINKLNELYDLGIEEYFNDPDAIIFIEWGNLFPEILPEHFTEINITFNQDDTRKFEFSSF